MLKRQSNRTADQKASIVALDKALLEVNLKALFTFVYGTVSELI